MQRTACFFFWNNDGLYILSFTSRCDCCFSEIFRCPAVASIFYMLALLVSMLQWKSFSKESLFIWLILCVLVSLAETQIYSREEWLTSRRCVFSRTPPDCSDIFLKIYCGSTWLILLLMARVPCVFFPWYSFVLLYLNSIFATRMKRRRDIMWMTHKSSHKTTLNLHAFHLMDARWVKTNP